MHTARFVGHHWMSVPVGWVYGEGGVGIPDILALCYTYPPLECPFPWYTPPPEGTCGQTHPPGDLGPGIQPPPGTE